MASTSDSKESVVAGVASGLLGPGESVTWRARHFRVWHRLTSRITAFDPPDHFRDSMVKGSFRRLDHDHYFEPDGEDGQWTMMREVFDFTSPFGPIGWVVNRILLTRYMRNFLVARNEVIKRAAEGEEWSRYLPES